MINEVVLDVFICYNLVSNIGQRRDKEQRQSTVSSLNLSELLCVTAEVKTTGQTGE